MVLTIHCQQIKMHTFVWNYSSFRLWHFFPIVNVIEMNFQVSVVGKCFRTFATNNICNLLLMHTRMAIQIKFSFKTLVANFTLVIGIHFVIFWHFVIKNFTTLEFENNRKQFIDCLFYSKPFDLTFICHIPNNKSLEWCYSFSIERNATSYASG